MRRFIRLLTAVTVVILGAAAGVRAQQTAPVDPGAMAALEKMGGYLRSLRAFQVEAVTSTEEVLNNGQKVQFEAVVNTVARMPDRVLIEVHSDRRDRAFVYDGKQFTIFAKRVNFYATVPAPPTVFQLADALDTTYDIELPVADLFRWGGPTSKAAAITSAMVVGPSEIGGITCTQYAFRQEGLDWQLWIQLGDYPLPRKLVLTTLTDDARPQHVARFTWNLAPSFNDEAFTFVPPKGASRVVLSEIK